MFYEEPKGWSELQLEALKQTETENLVRIIQAMHRLLDEHEASLMNRERLRLISS